MKYLTRIITTAFILVYTYAFSFALHSSDRIVIKCGKKLFNRHELSPVIIYSKPDHYSKIVAKTCLTASETRATVLSVEGFWIKIEITDKSEEYSGYIFAEPLNIEKIETMQKKERNKDAPFKESIQKSNIKQDMETKKEDAELKRSNRISDKYENLKKQETLSKPKKAVKEIVNEGSKINTKRKTGYKTKSKKEPIKTVFFRAISVTT